MPERRFRRPHHRQVVAHLGKLDAAFLKLEIIREARIDLAGKRVRGIPTLCLDRATAFAEKLLANADRGLDRSTLSRDAIDLAFMVQVGPGLPGALRGSDGHRRHEDTVQRAGAPVEGNHR